MTRHHFDDETLMAFADGELDDAAAAEVEAAVNADPALAERIALFAESRALARDAFLPRLDEPVPASLRAAVEAAIAEQERSGGTVVPLPRRRPAAANQNRPRWSRFAMAAAASVAIVAAGLGGYLAGSGGDADGQQVALIAVPGIADALSTVASGEETELAGGTGSFRAVSSFVDGADRLCREFEYSATDGAYVAIACREATDWSLAFAMGTGGNTGGYAPASSLETLDSYLMAIEAGQPLSPEEEAAALAQ